MVGLWGAHVPIHLLVLMSVTTVIFAVPIIFTHRRREALFEILAASCHFWDK